MRAQELGAVWDKAPRCAFGLTVYNLDDVTRVNPWVVTDDMRRDITRLVQVAREKCSARHEVFVHNAGFFPDLRPHVYPELVLAVSDWIRLHGCRVQDGIEFVDRVHRRDVTNLPLRRRR